MSRQDWWDNPFAVVEEYNPFAEESGETPVDGNANEAVVEINPELVNTLGDDRCRQMYLGYEKSIKLSFIESILERLMALHDQQDVHGEIGLSAVAVKFNEDNSINEVIFKDSSLETQADQVPYVISKHAYLDYPPESVPAGHVTQAGDVYMLGGLIRALLSEELVNTQDKIGLLRIDFDDSNNWDACEGESLYQYVNLLFSIFLDKMQAASPALRPDLNVVRQVFSAYSHIENFDVEDWQGFFNTMLAQWLPVAELKHPIQVMKLSLLELDDLNVWDLSRVHTYDAWISAGLFESNAFHREPSFIQSVVRQYCSGDTDYPAALIALNKLGELYNSPEVIRRVKEKNPTFMEYNLRKILLAESLEAAPGFADGIYLVEDDSTPTPTGELVDRLTWLKRCMVNHLVTGFLVSDQRDDCIQSNSFSSLRSMIYEPLKTARAELIKVFKPDYVDAQIKQVDQQLLELFKAQYMKQYGRLFHNPFSTMYLRIKYGELRSIEDVFRYKDLLQQGYGRQSDCFGREVITRTEQVLSKLG